MEQRKTVVIIPAYEPDGKLISLTAALKEHGFEVLVVDDGSSSGSSGIFQKLDVVLLQNPRNLGKGAALKNGIAHLTELFPDVEHFITADADGQHSVTDICRMRDELEAGCDFVLSVRRISRNSPLKSQIGNALSRFLFALANNHYLPDNQSGLRGFHIRHIPWMLQVPGEKYDYELNVLLIAEKQGISVRRLPIETIYFDNNEGSHFKPLLDTLRIYRQFFRTQIFAVLSIALNLVLVILHTVFLGYRWFPGTIFLCWGIYALLCFVVERYTIFRHISYTPGVRRLIFSIFRYAIYTLICFAIFATFHWPFIVAFLVALVLTSLMEFYMLKVSYDQ